SMLKADFPMLQKTTDVPVSVVGQFAFSTRDELDAFFKQVFEAMKEKSEKQGLWCKVGKVVTVEEYAKKAPVAEKEYLTKLPSSQIRIVYVSIVTGGRGDDTAGVFVRVLGPRVRVTGIGQPGRNQ